MGSKDRLKDYRAKRDVRRSGEPAGRTSRGTDDGGQRFVIQRHDASTLHFDFRLQVGDVLASWSVPKGPSTDPTEKRLAVRTEDHPLEYAEFEGRIADGEYGAGTVVVWDAGTFRNTTEDRGKPVPLEDALERGHVAVWMEGDKLRGGYALTKTRWHDRDDEWLLVKMKDEGADKRRNPSRTQPESVLSGRTNEELDSDA
jgi:DNA ligase D-like protein (predicted 3'-phosphoesterase)